MVFDFDGEALLSHISKPAPEMSYSGLILDIVHTKPRPWAYAERILSAISTDSPAWSFISGLAHLKHINTTLMNMLGVATLVQAPRGGGNELGVRAHHQDHLLCHFVGLASSGKVDMLTILSSLVLLVQWDLSQAECAATNRGHFEAFAAALLAHGQAMIPALRAAAAVDAAAAATACPPHDVGSSADTPVRFHSVLNRLGLFMAYADSMASTFDLGGCVMETFWGRYPGSLQLMFDVSKDVLRDIWGTKYPLADVVFEERNGPGFDLLHESHLLRYRVSLFRWSLADADKAAKAASLHKEIQAKIDSLFQQRAAMIDLVSLWPRPETELEPVKRNLRVAVAFFHAVVIDFCRLTCDYHDKSPQPRRSLSAVLPIAAIIDKNEPDISMYRIAFPLFMAGVEAVDFTHQSWILDCFRNLGRWPLNMNIRKAYQLLPKVVEHQRLTNDRVDFRKWMEEQPQRNPEQPEHDVFIL